MALRLILCLSLVASISGVPCPDEDAPRNLAAAVHKNAALPRSSGDADSAPLATNAANPASNAMDAGTGTTTSHSQVHSTFSRLAIDVTRSDTSSGTALATTSSSTSSATASNSPSRSDTRSDPAAGLANKAGTSATTGSLTSSRVPGDSASSIGSSSGTSPADGIIHGGRVHLALTKGATTPTSRATGPTKSASAIKNKPNSQKIAAKKPTSTGPSSSTSTGKGTSTSKKSHAITGKPSTTARKVLAATKSSTAAPSHCTLPCIVGIAKACQTFKDNPQTGRALYEAGDFNDYLAECRLSYSGIAVATACTNDTMLYSTTIPLSQVYNCLAGLPSWVTCAYQASGACATATPKPPTGNAVTNGGFEASNWKTGWKTWGAFDPFLAWLSTGVKHSGQQSLNAYYTNENDNEILLYQLVSVLPKRRYRLSYWLYQTSNQTQCGTVGYFTPDVADTYGPAGISDAFLPNSSAPSIDLSTQPAGQWLHFQTTFTTMSSYGSIGIDLMCNPNDAGPMTMYVDDITLTPV